MRPLSRRRPIAGRRGTRHLGNGNTPFHTYIQRTRTQTFTVIHVTFSWHISLQVFCRHMLYVRHVCRYSNAWYLHNCGEKRASGHGRLGTHSVALCLTVHVRRWRITFGYACRRSSTAALLRAMLRPITYYGAADHCGARRTFTTLSLDLH